MGNQIKEPAPVKTGAGSVFECRCVSISTWLEFVKIL